LKATGIVRRIDDLGRIVVPKEIRRVLKIEENDPVEIYTNENGDIVIKKYSVLSGWDNIAQQYAESLSNSTGFSVCISDNEKVLAVSGVSKKVFIGKKIDSWITDIINFLTCGKADNSVINANMSTLSSFVMPYPICGNNPSLSMLFFMISVNFFISIKARRLPPL